MILIAKGFLLDGLARVLVVCLMLYSSVATMGKEHSVIKLL